MLAHSDVEREIYESREKALRDERARMYDARTEGMHQGVEKGVLIGRVEAYQELTGRQLSPRADLERLSLDELEALSRELRQALAR